MSDTISFHAPEPQPEPAPTQPQPAPTKPAPQPAKTAGKWKPYHLGQ